MTALLKASDMVPKFDAEAEKARILAKFDMAEIETMELMGARILVAKWIREKEGSFHLVQQTKKEDEYQSKIGLVIKVGPLAFLADESHDWHGQGVKVGDWVMYGYADGHDFDYRPVGSFERTPCKIINEGHVQMVLARPDFAY